MDLSNTGATGEITPSKLNGQTHALTYPVIRRGSFDWLDKAQTAVVRNMVAWFMHTDVAVPVFISRNGYGPCLDVVVHYLHK